jgi:ABC-type transporter lipoprotein component MlaA
MFNLDGLSETVKDVKEDWKTASTAKKVGTGFALGLAGLFEVASQMGMFNIPAGTSFTPDGSNYTGLE